MNNFANQRWSPQRATLWLVALAAIALPLTTKAEILFSEVTNEAGMVGSKTSFGLSWGDLNGDGWPDLFMNNHALKNTIFLNLGGSKFADVTDDVDGDRYWTGAGAWEDTHGGTWADFDNDGDQDLLVTTGVCCDPQFFKNENGKLYNHTVELGFGDNADKEGHHSLWFDIDKDGLLDVALMSAYPARLMRQSSGNFAREPYANFQCQANQYAQLIDVNANGHLDIICVATGGKFTDHVYDTSTFPFQDITDLLPFSVDANDVIVGDFDNNLRNDMLLVRGDLRLSEVRVFNDRFLEAQLVANDRGFSITSEGILQVDLDWNQNYGSGSFNNIRIGANGVSPTSQFMVLDPANTAYWGTKIYVPRTWPELYIGFDPVAQRWSFDVYSAGKWVNTYIQIESSADLTDLAVRGTVPPDLPIYPVYLSNLPTGFQNTTYDAGLASLMQCVSGAAADFDNDMDQDIYLVCRGGVENIENRLYENLGNGKFRLVANEGGAKSIVGGAVADQAGTGENVAVADFNGDGLVDMAVTNGLNMRPWGQSDGPYQLFRNTSAPQNWVEIDLVGTVSNRDAIGAKIYATAGGIAQLREQNGGFHRWSQHHQRVHFGLAGNTLVDIAVNWPSGLVQTFSNISSNKIYRITEGAGVEEVVLVAETNSQKCGKPAYNKSTDRNMFLWQDCTSGDAKWYMRTVAGGSATAITYGGKITADMALGEIAPFSYESSDVLRVSNNPPQVDFLMKLSGTGEDGLDIAVPSGASVCLDIANLPSGANLLLGAGRIQMPSRFNLKTLEACVAPPLPEIGACGQPQMNFASDGAVFIWKDCDADNWHVRASSAAGYKKYTGNLSSSAPFQALTPYSIESTDILDNTVSSQINFVMGLSNPSVDGFNFTASCSAQTEFALSAPPGAVVLVGADREVAPANFNLNDLISCRTTQP